MALLRANEVTMKGNPIFLVGPKIKPGDLAPDFACVGADLAPVTLASSKGKIRLFSVVPSLDTPVCGVQTKKLNDELKAMGDAVAAYTISLDLPFAMKRFCSENGVSALENLSDVHDKSFGRHYGVLIEGIPIQLLARALFVVDASDVVRHVEIVPEIGREPDYEAALSAIRALL